MPPPHQESSPHAFGASLSAPTLGNILRERGSSLRVGGSPGGPFTSGYAGDGLASPMKPSLKTPFLLYTESPYDFNS